MNQEIIVIIIIALAVVYVGYLIYRKMHHKQSADACDSGCDGCGADCSLRDIKKGSSQVNKH